MAVLACTAGFASPEAWHQHYGSWSSANSLGAKISVFIEGSANFVTTLGVPHPLAVAFIAVVVVAVPVQIAMLPGSLIPDAGEISGAIDLPF